MSNEELDHPSVLAWNALSEFAANDAAIVGLLLSGSRGRGFPRPGSDWDCYLITAGSVDDESLPISDPSLDVSVLTLVEFQDRAAPDAVDRWEAYAFVHVEVVVDKLDGEVAAIAAAKEFLPEAVAERQSRNQVDEYINSTVRAAKCTREGQDEGAALDAAGSVAPAIAALFAFERRIPPYNRFLTWELETHPLEGLLGPKSAPCPRCSQTWPQDG